MSKQSAAEKAGEQFDVETLRKKLQPQQSVDLGNGLELWQVPIAMLQEQSVNARAMGPEAFLQLTDTIKRDKRLESMPLCALTTSGLEIISGHHRVRAARKAEINVIWVLVDVSGISRDRLRAKQLAHNSIQGADNADLIRKIYESIQDVDARIEAFINVDQLPEMKVPLELSTKDLEVQFTTRQAVLVFTEPQKEAFKKALDLLATLQEGDEVFLATREEYETLVTVLDKASAAFKITSTPTLFARMAEIVIEHCEKLEKEKVDGAAADAAA